MKYENIILGKDVEIDPSSSVNNVRIGDRVRIAKRCSIFGGPENLLEIGNESYVGMNTMLNGFKAKLTIGAHVSIAQNVYIMVDSGPNASESFQKVFPVEIGPVDIADHCWIGVGAVIMPNVKLGKFCVVAANSFVNKSFPSYSIIGGSPARLIRSLSKDEINKITYHD
jgi:acetyltransferase-like isoleucine patch superfamily enzyme